MPSEIAVQRRAMEARARDILRRYAKAIRETKSAKAIPLDGMPAQHPTEAGGLDRRQEWCCDVRGAVRAAGEEAGGIGARVLVYRCTAKQNSPNGSFGAIGSRLGMTRVQTTIMFHLAVRIFLAHLDKHGIPDHYADRRADADAVIRQMRARCAAIEVAEPCAMIA